MENLKKNRIFLIAFVAVMVAGLVAAYAPSIFAPPPLYGEPSEPPASTDLKEVFPSSSATSTPTSTPRTDAVPATQGFSGLSEEGQSLKDLDLLLGE
ncbi:hypothetical protein COU12_01235 [Candidatus Jorgensenbacteria bacterium CG10_big_fil_rev_8_21_14_0_10_54_38]|uniref:Uncharacterized protein n=2 Tax=Candidatus Joergenseniibacteriota TaxID=1752739 RepID=A0A2M6WG88_9BACT|nr:MAG: hypothetical protein COX26_01105 [Candidatus Jorgensenbacteria bacterium CG23_combo_of_CG06-09_8_20_14_all_54_14]PIT91777.1 MAG: hypothetical protein COU12_01235 [Candidatus Jorgensenbacteria bacterium CG10_big_fil_rev_8_21_14_0_10_54_38]